VGYLVPARLLVLAIFGNGLDSGNNWSRKGYPRSEQKTVTDLRNVLKIVANCHASEIAPKHLAGLVSLPLNGQPVRSLISGWNVEFVCSKFSFLGL
jgi:hypothetical protein